MDEVTFPRKNRRSILHFFKGLDPLGKVIFGFLVIFCLSLVIGSVLLFLRKRFLSERGWLSLKEAEPPPELTLEALYNREDLGEDIGLSEDGCPQRFYRAKLLGSKGDRWLVRFNGKKVYLANPCQEITEEDIGKSSFLLLTVENCGGHYFSECALGWEGKVARVQNHIFDVFLSEGEKITVAWDPRVTIFVVGSLRADLVGKSKKQEQFDLRDGDRVLIVTDSGGRLKRIYVER